MDFLVDVTGVLCLEWTLLRLEERVTSSSEATSKERLPAISESPRGPLYSVSAQQRKRYTVHAYMC